MKIVSVNPFSGKIYFYTIALRPVPGHVDSGTGRPVSKEPVCGAKALNATVCDPLQRTVNTGQTCWQHERAKEVPVALCLSHHVETNKID